MSRDCEFNIWAVRLVDWVTSNKRETISKWNGAHVIGVAAVEQLVRCAYNAHCEFHEEPNEPHHWSAVQWSVEWSDRLYCTLLPQWLNQSALFSSRLLCGVDSLLMGRDVTSWVELREARASKRRDESWRNKWMQIECVASRRAHYSIGGALSRGARIYIHVRCARLLPTVTPPHRTAPQPQAAAAAAAGNFTRDPVARQANLRAFDSTRLERVLQSRVQRNSKQLIYSILCMQILQNNILDLHIHCTCTV